MGIMDMFRQAPQQAVTPAADSGVQVPASVAANTTIPGNGSVTVPDGSGPAAFPAADGSPLENFKDLWDTSDAGGNGTSTSASLVPSLKVDPAKVMQAVSGMDFTKSLSPELLAKATSGDVGAFAEAMNKVAQLSFGQAAISMTGIVEKAMSQQSDAFHKTVMPELFRKNRVDQDLSQANPIFDNPAVKPMLDAVKAQMAIKYPEASAAELSTKAKAYMEGFATEMLKSSKTAAASESFAPGNKANSPVDWESFFSS